MHDRGLAVQLLGEVGGPWAAEPLRKARQTRRGRRFADEIDDALRALGAAEDRTR
jgi:hypothetical protein